MNTYIPDLQTYAFHQKAAQILGEQPAHIEQVYATLNEWSEMQGSPYQRWARQWLEIIQDLSTAEVAEFIVREEEDINFLRKGSPFIALLTEEERSQITERYLLDYEQLERAL